jgi:superfamily II DNA or RNA helicase
MTGGFLETELLLAGGPARLNIAVERLLGHLAFDDIRNIDGSGDGGADILAVRRTELFVFQTKWSSRRTVGKAGINEVEAAKSKYRADRAVLVTNAIPDQGAVDRQRRLLSVGVRVDIWHRGLLPKIYDEIPDRVARRVSLRRYQQEAADRIDDALQASGRALLIMATGLGKTVVGGEVVRRHLDRYPGDDVLIVAHMKDLVAQLEKAIWRHLPKTVVTQLLTGEEKPYSLAGVTCATIESAANAVLNGYQPALVMIDETHHVSESGEFQELLDNLKDARQFGVTATPWRGDNYDITARFGPASFTMGIADGMAQGFLAQADYRLYVDDIDWDLVRNASQHGYSLRELNDKLFLPQRDEAIVDLLREAWSSTPDPRAIVFCRTIEHAERIADLLARSSPNWRRAACLHSRKSKRERDVLMSDFRLGRVPIVTVVDIFNEGVDIPDVNIIAFLRLTHSRRIFVQQLGRGLRLRPGKEVVRVLDFVTDIRRVAAALQLKRSLEAAAGAPETVALPTPSRIMFDNAAVGSLMDAWINDASELETAADESRLQFPEYTGAVG